MHNRIKMSRGGIQYVSEIGRLNGLGDGSTVFRGVPVEQVIEGGGTPAVYSGIVVKHLDDSWVRPLPFKAGMQGIKE